MYNEWLGHCYFVEIAAAERSWTYAGKVLMSQPCVFATWASCCLGFMPFGSSQECLQYRLAEDQMLRLLVSAHLD